jgi:predicted ArsR family transcriptional regulator
MSSERQILTFLKRRGAQATAAIARHLKITLPGTRKHLGALTKARLVSFIDERRGVGRPRRLWQLTEEAQARFPDGHDVMTVELIEAIREGFGEWGLARTIALRESQTQNRYETALARCRNLRSRLQRLAELRSKEGYMAEYQALSDGTFLLVENHCPIRTAARRCEGLCRSELAIFRRLLAAEAVIEREEHLLAGTRRCAYRIRPLMANPR